MWDGGMGPYGYFCLDFYDSKCKAPVNVPPRHVLYLPPGAALMFGIIQMVMLPAGFGRPTQPEYIPPSLRHKAQANASSSQIRGGLGSWERNLAMQSIPKGEEKRSIPEGQHAMLRPDGHPGFTFQIPSGSRVL